MILEALDNSIKYRHVIIHLRFSYINIYITSYLYLYATANSQYGRYQYDTFGKATSAIIRFIHFIEIRIFIL
jgi:hypothetical protein